MHTEITDLDWTLRQPDNVGIISFKFRGFPCEFREPLDVILGNDESSKKWIWKHYRFLLETIKEENDVPNFLAVERKEPANHAE